MNVCIIGGLGFIGTHLHSALEKEGHTVHIVDFYASRDITPNQFKLLLKDSTYSECNIKNLEDVKKLNLPKYDIVYLFASLMRSGDCMQCPEIACDTNITGVSNVLTCLRGSNTRIVFSSTVHVYCDPDMLGSPVDETTPINNNTSIHLYPASKLLGETLIRSHNMLYGTNYTIFRFGIVYGPQGHKDMVLHTFISKAKKGETIIIQGDGSATRNFVYVDDIVRGNISVINNLEKSKNETINLCGDSNISIKELANLISDKIKSCKIESIAARTGDHIEPLISNKKANDLLGWTPQVSFEEGIKKSIEWL